MRRRRRRNPVSPGLALVSILGAAAAAAGVVIYAATKPAAAATSKPVSTSPVITGIQLNPLNPVSSTAVVIDSTNSNSLTAGWAQGGDIIFTFVNPTCQIVSVNGAPVNASSYRVPAISISDGMTFSVIWKGPTCSAGAGNTCATTVKVQKT